MKNYFNKHTSTLIIILIILLSSCSKSEDDIIDNTDDNTEVDNVTLFVSEYPKGKNNGDSEENAADYLDSNFWILVNKKLKTSDVKVKFLAGDYFRAYIEGGLSLKSIGHKENKLTISGNENVLFQLSEGYPDVSTLINFEGCQNILIKDLHFTGDGIVGYILAFRSKAGSGSTQNITIENCSWIDLGGVIYGATGCHHKGTSDITYKNCTFKRVGIDSHSHFMYHANDANKIKVTDCHFEDCTGEYVRFRNHCDFALVQNCVFIRTDYEYIDRAFISVPLYSKKPPGTESFATNYSFTNNKFINTSSKSIAQAILFLHSGWSPLEWNHLLTPEEGAILQYGTLSERAALLKSNFNIDVTKIRVTDNTYEGVIPNNIWFTAYPSQGAPSKGWSGGANITDLINDSDKPFEWEKK